MNTKQLLEMNQNDIIEICNGACGTDQCPFKKSLRYCRQDSFCVREVYHSIDRWIASDERDIQDLKDDIRIIRQHIAKYKRWKRKIENELTKEELEK